MPVRGEEVVLGVTFTVTDLVPLGPLAEESVIQAKAVEADHAVSLLIVRVTVTPVSATLSVGAPVTVNCFGAGAGAGAGAAQGARFISLAAQREPPIVVRQASATIQGVVLFIFVDILLCV